MASGGGGRDGQPVFRTMGVLDESSLFSMLFIDNGVDIFMMLGSFHAVDRTDDRSITTLVWQMQKSISIVSISFNSESDAKNLGVQGLPRSYGTHLALGSAVEFRMHFEHLSRYMRHEFVGEGRLAKYLLFLNGKFKGPLGQQLATELAKRLDVFKIDLVASFYMKVLRNVILPIVGIGDFRHIFHEMDQRALADFLQKELGAFSLAGTYLRKRPGVFLQEQTPDTHIVAEHEGGAQPGRTEVFDDPVEGADVASLDLFVPTVALAAAPAAAQPRFSFMYMEPEAGADVATLDEF